MTPELGDHLSPSTKQEVSPKPCSRLAMGSVAQSYAFIATAKGGGAGESAYFIGVSLFFSFEALSSYIRFLSSPRQVLDCNRDPTHFPNVMLQEINSWAPGKTTHSQPIRRSTATRNPSASHSNIQTASKSYMN